jgi:hypothetical protein
MLSVLCFHILPLSRIPRYDLGRQTPTFQEGFYHSEPGITNGGLGSKGVPCVEDVEAVILLDSYSNGETWMMAVTVSKMVGGRERQEQRWRDEEAK